MEFYKRINDLKVSKGLGWRDIGKIIGKNEATIRISFKRESLSDLEKREIEKFFDLEKEEQNNDIVLTKDGVELSVDEIAIFLAKNENAFKKNIIFSNIVEKMISKRLLDITSTKEKFNEYLNS